MDYKNKRTVSAGSTGKKVAAVASSLVLVGSSVPAQVLTAIAPSVAWATNTPTANGIDQGSRITLAFYAVDGTVTLPSGTFTLTKGASDLALDNASGPMFGLVAGYSGTIKLAIAGANGTGYTNGDKTSLETIVNALPKSSLVTVDDTNYSLDLYVEAAPDLTKTEGGSEVKVGSVEGWGTYHYADRTLSLVAGEGVGTLPPSDVLATGAATAIKDALSGASKLKLTSKPGWSVSLDAGAEATSASVTPSATAHTFTVKAALTDATEAGAAGSVLSGYTKDTSVVDKYYYGSNVLQVDHNTEGANPAGGLSLEKAAKDGKLALKVTAEKGFVAAVTAGGTAVETAKEVTASGANLKVAFNPVLTADGSKAAETVSDMAATMYYGLDTIKFSYPSGVSAADVWESVPTLTSANAALKAGWKVEIDSAAALSNTVTDTVTVNVFAQLTDASKIAQGTTSALGTTTGSNTYYYGKSATTLEAVDNLKYYWDGTRILFKTSDGLDNWSKALTNTEAAKLVRFAPTTAGSLKTDTVSTNTYLHYFAPSVTGSAVTIRAASAASGINNVSLAWSGAAADGAKADSAADDTADTTYKLLTIYAPAGYTISSVSGGSAALYPAGTTKVDSTTKAYTADSATSAVIRMKVPEAATTVTVSVSKKLTTGAVSETQASAIVSDATVLIGALDDSPLTLAYGGPVSFKTGVTGAGTNTYFKGDLVGNWDKFIATSEYGAWSASSPLSFNPVKGFKVTVSPSSWSGTSSIVNATVTIDRALTYEEVTSTDSTTGTKTKKLHQVADESDFKSGKALTGAMTFQFGADSNEGAAHEIKVAKGVTVKYAATSDGCGKVLFRAPAGYTLDAIDLDGEGDGSTTVAPSGSTGWADVALKDVAGNIAVTISSARTLTDADGKPASNPSGPGTYYFGATKITLGAGTRIASVSGSTVKFALGTGASGLAVSVRRGSTTDKKTVTGSSYDLVVKTDDDEITATSGTTTFAYTAKFGSETRSYVTGVDAELPKATGTWQTADGTKVTTKAQLDALVKKDGDVIVLTDVKPFTYSVKYTPATGAAKTVDYTVGVDATLEPGSWQTSAGVKVTSKAQLDAMVTADKQVIELVAVPESPESPTSPESPSTPTSPTSPTSPESPSTPSTPDSPVEPVLHEGWNDPKGDGTSWCYVIDGKKVANRWIDDGGWYYFDSTGAMVTGWMQDGFEGGLGIWYYLSKGNYGPKGRMTTGWIFDGAWYYMNDAAWATFKGQMVRSKTVPGGTLGADGKWIA